MKSVKSSQEVLKNEEMVQTDTIFNDEIPSSEEYVEVADTTKNLKNDHVKIETTEICSICKEEVENKAELPCKDVFCYDCINRHLKRRRFCPNCKLTNITHLDIKTYAKRYRMVYKLPKKTPANLKKTLKKNKIDISGNKESLKWRYEQFLCYQEVQAYKPDEIIDEEIAYKISRKEQSIADRKNKKKLTKEIRDKLIELMCKARELYK